MTKTRKPFSLGQVEEILYEDLSDKPATWDELGLTGDFPFLSYTDEQELTEGQKTQALENLGITSINSGVTLGTENGLSLSDQELSLSLATTEANGAMSSADKLKLVGGNVVSGSGISLSGTATGRLLSSGNLTISVDATVVKVSGDQTITGLKEVRRYGANDGSTEGIVESWGIDSGSLYKLQLMNTQNVQSADGEVQWHLKYTSNTGSGSAKSRPMIGFARGAITILGGKSLPSTYYSTVVTQEGSNAGSPTWRYPLMQYAYGVSQFESGIVVGTDELRVNKITGDAKLYVEGSIRTIAPSGGAEENIRMGTYSVEADTTSDIRWRVKVGDKIIDLLGVEVV